MARLVALVDRSVDLDTGRIDGGGELRAMELKVLRYLVDHPNVLVTHQDLLERVWGYAPQAHTRTVYSTWHRLRSALEHDPARPRHLITVPGLGVRFVTHDAPPPTNLVPPRDRLVGRTAELEHLAHLDARLITLTGPGGAGKTRLAREHGWRVRSARTGGTWFCDLTHSTTAVGAAETIADVLGLNLERPVDDLGPALASRGPTLLVLDNLESVLDAPDGAELGQSLVGWLDRAPGLAILATSRRPVRVAGELRFAVGPLGLPPDDVTLDGDAVALLVDRTRSHDPSFDPTVDPTAAVALVRALDGIPLAIEIAAGHAAALGPQGVLRALREHGSLHSRGEGPERHRSLDAVVAWSWERLPEFGRVALSQLAAFARGFSLDGAIAVLSLPAGAPPAAEVLTDLVERGLVSLDPRARRRFALFAIVRTFIGAPPADAVARHAAFYARFAAEILDAEGGVMPEADPHNGVERDEVLLAARSVLDGVVDVPRPGPLVDYAVRVAIRHGRRSDGRALGETTPDRLDDEARVRLAAWQSEGMQYHGPDVARTDLALLPRACVRAGFPQLAVRVELRAANHLANIGDVEGSAGAVDRARRLMAEMAPHPDRLRAHLAADLASAEGSLATDLVERGDHYVRAAHHYLLAGRPAAAAAMQVNHAQGGHPEERPAEMEQVILTALEDLPQHWPLERVVALVALSTMRRHQGRLADALGAADDAVAVMSEVPRPLFIGGPYALVERARVHVSLGDLTAAERDATQARVLAHDLGHHRTEALAVQVLASVAYRRGDPSGSGLLVDALDRTLRFMEWEAAMNAAIDLIDLWVGIGFPDQAIAVADRVLACGTPLATGGSWIAMARAELHRTVGDPGSALADLRAAEATGGARSTPLARLARAALSAELGADDGSPPPDASGPWAHVHRARLALARGDTEGARTEVAGVVPEPGQVLLGRALAALR